MTFERTFFAAPSIAMMRDRPTILLLLPEMADRGTSDVVVAVEVDVDDGIPVRVIHLVEHLVPQDARRIDHCVKTAEFIEGPFDHRLGVGTVGHAA